MADAFLAGFDRRLTVNPEKMGGRPCIRGMRITVGTVLRCLASGMTREEILADYPYLESADIDACLGYAAAMSEDRIIPVESTRRAAG